MRAAAIAAAIALLHPGMPRATRTAYARALELDPDPLALVALVEHESRWDPSAVGGLDGACVGLGQKCLRFADECRSGLSSPACAGRKAALLDGSRALHTLVAEAATWRVLCRRRTHREPTLARWFHGYAGFDRGDVVCGQRRRGGRWRDVPTPALVVDVARIATKIGRR